MNSAPIQIRHLVFQRATAEDVHIFAALERKSTSRIYGPIGAMEDALREIRESTLYFIRSGEIVVGTAAYRVRPDDSVYISCVAIDPAYRRQGIARAAMTYILEKTKDASRIDLVTHPENANALRLYTSLGFKNNPDFSDDTAACMVWSEAIHVMLLTHAKWRTFTSRPIPPATSSEVMLALSCDSREAVDAMNKVAADNGGTADVNPARDLGFMYNRNLADPDAHVWEAIWMKPA
jgi:predicted lactoylglutathione lyase